MKGDISRLTFNSKKHFSTLIMQQGRVQLDADWNEQAAMQTYFLRTLAKDIIGDHGGPQRACGFEVICKDDQINSRKKQTWETDEEFDQLKQRLKELQGNLEKTIIFIGPGHYYVDGILCENNDWIGYNDQDDYPLHSACNEDCKGDYDHGALIGKNIDLRNHLLYLDVWERHISWIEDPELLEPALGGPDTTSRSKIVWQVKIHEIDNSKWTPPAHANNDSSYLCKFIEHIKNPKCSQPLLKAKTDIPKNPEKGSCLLKTDARYVGFDNRLYRVEIHKPGIAESATFKWSRDNGSTIYPIIDGGISISDDKTIVSLDYVCKDDHLCLKEGCYVEFVYDDYVLLNRADPLMKVEKVDKKKMEVTLIGVPAIRSSEAKSSFVHPYLRLWNHLDSGIKKGTKLIEGAIQVLEGDNKKNWLPLENGIQIQFQKSVKKDGNAVINNLYRTGDYWLIPARVSTGDIEWPKNGVEPEAQPPFGIKHHYAPLAVIDQNGKVFDCRHYIEPAKEMPPSY